MDKLKIELEILQELQGNEKHSQLLVIIYYEGSEYCHLKNKHDELLVEGFGLENKLIEGVKYFKTSEIETFFINLIQVEIVDYSG